MKTSTAHVCALALALALWGAGARRDFLAYERIKRAVAQDGDRSVAPAFAVTVGDTIPDAVDQIVERDIFQEGASPATPGASEPIPPGAVSVTARPVLTLRGVVGGPPWSAIVAGVPGRQEAVLMHLDDTLAGLRVATIRRDTVVLRAKDTTWILSLPR